MLARERDELRRAKALVPNLNRVTQRTPRELARQQFQKSFEVDGIEFFGRQELPIDRAEPVAQRRDALEERRDAVEPGERQLDREPEAGWRLRGPTRVEQIDFALRGLHRLIRLVE